MRYSYHEKTKNRNGRILLDFTTEKNFEITSTGFHKKVGKQWTFVGPGGAKSQIDFILINKKWRNSVLNVEPYNSFSTVGSDHRIVTARIRLSLRKTKRKQMREEYDWEILKRVPTLQQAFSVEVENHFQCLQELDESSTERYQRFINSYNQAAKTILPTTSRKKSYQVSTDQRDVDARKKTKAAFDSYHVNTSENNRLGYEQAKKELEMACDNVTEENLSNKVKEIEESNINCKHSNSWNLINSIIGRKTSMKGQISKATAAERTENWFKHFKNLLGNEAFIEDEFEEIVPVLTDVEIRDDAFSMEEYVRVKFSLVDGKACGEDGIKPEILKHCYLDDIILEFCNTALVDQDVPRQWSMLNIIPIPKTGDLRSTSNYHGISLSSVVAKAYNKMILNRIKLGIDHHLRTNQNGFRNDRSTTSHIFTIRHLMEGAKKKSLPTVMTFIDFKKAFDTIHRGKMFKY